MVRFGRVEIRVKKGPMDGRRRELSWRLVIEGEEDDRFEAVVSVKEKLGVYAD